MSTFAGGTQEAHCPQAFDGLAIRCRVLHGTSYSPGKDIQSSILVTIQHNTTARAAMRPHGKRFFASIRGRIVALLRRAGRTVDELTQALDLTDNAVRAHLAALERDGMVRSKARAKVAVSPHMCIH